MKPLHWYATYWKDWKAYESWIKEKKDHYPADVLGMNLPEPKPRFKLTPKGIKEKE